MSRLRGSYPLAVATALLALCPNLVLSTGSLPLETLLEQDLGTSQTWLQVSTGLSNAALAAGVVVAAQLAQRFVQRPFFLCYAAGFVVGSLLAALAPSLPLFLVGRVMEGGSTGLMMIAALPPLVTRYGVGRLSWTVAIVNVGIFGATTLGPIVGGIFAGSGDWRLLLWLEAAVGALALLSAWVGFPEFDPPDPELPVDAPALTLTVVGAVLTFLATGLVADLSLTSVLFWVLLGLGLAALVALLVAERAHERPLMPVVEVSTQLPVTGTLVAMIAGAAFVTIVQLSQLHLSMVARLDPTAGGAAFWPMPIGLAVAAVAFGVVFGTRHLPVLVNVGLVALAGGCAVLLTLSADAGSGPVTLASGLLGFGAGATVAPGLFLAGLGVVSTRLGRALALVQLLRLTASYAVAPIVLFVAMQQSSLADGVRLGVWVCLVLALVGLAVSLAVPAVSGARLHAPDLQAWLEEGDRGMHSPPTGAAVRPHVDPADR